MTIKEKYENLFNKDLMDVIMSGNRVAIPSIYIKLMDAYCISTFGMIQSIDFDNIKNSIDNNVEYDGWVNDSKVYQLSRINNSKDYRCILDALYEYNIIQLKKSGRNYLIKINYSIINEFEDKYKSIDPGCIIKKKSRSEELLLKKIRNTYKD